MSLESAVKLVGKWPGDHSVPRRLAEMIGKAKGVEKARMQSMVEALEWAARTDEEHELINRHFG